MNARIRPALDASVVGYDQAMDLAQQFLGDLGIVDDARATDSLFIIGFKSAAEAVEPETFVLIDRATGSARFVTVNSAEPDPWPDARPTTGD